VKPRQIHINGENWISANAYREAEVQIEELGRRIRNLELQLGIAVQTLWYYESEYEYGIKAREAIKKIEEIG
jgi:hypothetical protein